MSLFEKAKQLPQSSPSSPRPGPVPPKFNPSSRPISIPRRPLPSVKKTTTSPKTLFEEKKEYERGDFLKKIAKDPIPFSGKWYDERKKMFSEAFPEKRFGTYISEKEAKTRLRELKKEGYRAKTLKGALEKRTGLKP